MPIRIPNDLPAAETLMQENILVNEIAVAGEELESYYLRVTGGMDHV